MDDEFLDRGRVPRGVYPSSGAARNARRRGPSINQQLMMFAFYGLQGMSPWEAYCQAGFVEEEQLSESQRQFHQKRAIDLAADERVGVLVKATRNDPRSLLKGSLGLAVVGLLDIAFNSKYEKTRLAALKEIMNRGGLPAESVSLTGKATELKKLTDKELEEEVLKLLVY